MNDGMIKGSGNSRYLKSVVDFLDKYPTYEDFAKALMTGTLPIDLNGLNGDGWQQQGTPLNKANLLADSTAAAFGLNSAATPNTMFAQVPTANMMWRQINAAGALTDTTLAGGDYFALSDVSAATGKKITVDHLKKYLDAKNSPFKESDFQKLIMGRLF